MSLTFVPLRTFVGDRTVNHCSLPRRRVACFRPVLSYASDSGVEKWLRTPQDVLALGPRLSIGLLASLPEAPSRVQRQVQRLTELSQDPRPLQEKGSLLLQELSAEVGDLVERGAVLEADILLNVGMVLPQEFKDALPSDIRRPLEGSLGVYDVVVSPVPEPEADMSPATLATNQTVAELVGLKACVEELRRSMSALAANTNPADEILLQIPVREARTSLNRSLAQLSPATFSAQGPVLVALEEATSLLEEVDGLAI